jgi:hypothetical protein
MMRSIHRCLPTLRTGARQPHCRLALGMTDAPLAPAPNSTLHQVLTVLHRLAGARYRVRLVHDRVHLNRAFLYERVELLP